MFQNAHCFPMQAPCPGPPPRASLFVVVRGWWPGPAQSLEVCPPNIDARRLARMQLKDMDGAAGLFEHERARVAGEDSEPEGLA